MKDPLLLRCPFCGASAEYKETRSHVTGDTVRWTVGCRGSRSDSGQHCIAHISFVTFSRKSEAAIAWNTRAPPP